MKLTRLTITGVLCLGSAALAQENANALKQRILVQAQSIAADDYAFTRTVRNDVTAASNKEQTVTVEKYDPTKSASSRWSLISVNGAAPSAEVLKKFQKESEKRRVPGYHRLANYLGSPAIASQDAQGRTVFRFSTLPKDSVVVVNSDVSDKATAEVVVNATSETPFAEQVRLTVKPTRIKLVMKLNSFDATSRYRIGPEGKPLLVEQISEMSGSGLGQEGTMRSVATYSDYRLVGRQH